MANKSIALDDVPEKTKKPNKKLTRVEKKERKQAEEKRKELISSNSKEKKKLAKKINEKYEGSLALFS